MTYWDEPAVLIAEDRSPVFLSLDYLPKAILLGSCSLQVYACLG
jgi:hypothetical protein